MAGLSQTSCIAFLPYLALFGSCMQISSDIPLGAKCRMPSFTMLGSMNGDCKFPSDYVRNAFKSQLVPLGAVLVCKAVYNVLFHPLRKVPGPKLSALSHWPYMRHYLNGTPHIFIKQLHQKYGDVVRYAPDEVSFISIETAFQDIYGFRTGDHKGHHNMGKDLRWYPDAVNGSPNIVTSGDADHTRMRRALAHAFSDNALKTQEGVLQEYGNLLVSQLSRIIKQSSEPVELVTWYQWTTFDVIAALLFGQSFDCLRDNHTHRFVETLIGAVPGNSKYYISKVYPWMTYLPSVSLHSKVWPLRMEVFNWIKQQIIKRKQTVTEQPDFMTQLLEQDVVGKSITDEELHANGVLLFGAGTETTATLLSAATYYVCQNPSAYKKLKDEVRGLWKNAEAIDLRTSNHGAPYLNAVINESLRLYSPVASGFPRKVPAGGDTISGYFIPEGTSVSVTHDSAYHSERNFKDADKFIPERWLGDAAYDGDKRRWMQPFSYGPRNCIGKNLAYAESRLFFAKMVRTFDFELDPSSCNWVEDTRNMFLRIKPKLRVHLKQAESICEEGLFAYVNSSGRQINFCNGQGAHGMLSQLSKLCQSMPLSTLVKHGRIGQVIEPPKVTLSLHVRAKTWQGRRFVALENMAGVTLMIGRRAATVLTHAMTRYLEPTEGRLEHASVFEKYFSTL